jgi:cytochrome P450
MNEHVQAAKAAPLFNPLSPDFIRDPYPFYQQLRENDPMHVTPFGAFLASRHAESSLVLRDKRFGKDFVARSIRRYGPDIMKEPVFQSMSHWMLQQDPPDHTRLRGLVVKAFTARAMMRTNGAIAVVDCTNPDLRFGCRVRAPSSTRECL